MSYDVFVQGFRDGDAAPMPSAAFHTVFGPHVDRTEPERHFWHVKAPDGSYADIYAAVDGESCNSLMLNHFTEGAVLDLLAEFIRQANAVIMLGDGPVLLAAPGQREHLPAELLEASGPVVIANGQDITAATAAV